MSNADARQAIKSIDRTLLSLREAILSSKAVQDATYLPEAFGEVARKLPVVPEVLISLKSNLQRSTVERQLRDNANAYGDLVRVSDECLVLASNLQDIFNSIAASDEDVWAGRYREAVSRGDRVERVMKKLLDYIGKVARAPLVDEERIGLLKGALESMEKVPSSLADESKGSYVFNNKANGVLPVHLQSGDTIFSSGLGAQFTAYATHTYFYGTNSQQPPAETSTSVISGRNGH